MNEFVQLVSRKTSFKKHSGGYLLNDFPYTIMLYG